MIPELPTPPPDFGGAPCAGKTRLFFPVDGERADEKARRVTQAKSLCAACPHRDACADWAIRNGEFADWTGIWGGMTPLERRIGRRRQRMQQRRIDILHGTLAGWSRHKKYGEPMCPACRQAKRNYDQSRRDGRRKENAA